MKWRNGGPRGTLLSTYLKTPGRNEYITLNEKILLTSDLAEAISFGETVIISISAQGLRSFLKRVTAYPVGDKVFVLCMKGLERTPASAFPRWRQRAVYQRIK